MSRRPDDEDERLARRREQSARRECKLEEALAAVRTGQRPNVKNTDQIDTASVEVPSGYTGKEGTQVQTAIRSIRGDPLGRLAKRRHITEAELRAGRAVQECLEVEIGGARAIDITKEAVDGRRFVDPFGDQHLRAMKRLRKFRAWLGVEGDALVRDIIGRRLFIHEAAAERGEDPEFLGKRFRECLRTLAQRLGYDVRGRERRFRDKASQMARCAHSPTLYRAARKARRG